MTSDEMGSAPLAIPDDIPPLIADPSGKLAPSCSDCQVAREADHRIANHLTMLAAYTALAAANVARGPGALPRHDVLLILEGIRAQIELIARAHRDMLLPGQQPTDLGQHLRDACEPLRLALPASVELIEDLPAACLVAGQQALTLTQIVTEAVINAIKHAFPGNRAGRIIVRCRLQDGFLIIEVGDNGVGLGQSEPLTSQSEPLTSQSEPLTSGGYGTRLMKALARQVGATLTFQSNEPGLKVLVSAPVQG